jgi:hypothetical protein
VAAWHDAIEKLAVSRAAVTLAGINPTYQNMLTKQLFPLVNEKSWRSLLVKDDRLYLMNQSYKTEEDFLKSYEKKGLLKKKREVAIADISQLAHPENKPKRLNVKAGTGKFFLDFAKEADLQELASYVQEQRRFTPETKRVGKFRAITPALLALGFTALITFVVHGDAVAFEEGGIVETGGRNSLFKMLFAWLGEKLGPQNTLIAGAVIAAVCLYFLFKALQNPPNEVVYE